MKIKTMTRVVANVITLAFLAGITTFYSCDYTCTNLDSAIHVFLLSGTIGLTFVSVVYWIISAENG